MGLIRIPAVIVSGVLAVGLAGCGSEEGGSASTAPLGSELGSKIGEVAGKTVDDLARIYADQLGEQESQRQSLAASAAELDDQELNELLDQIDSKLKAMSAKISEIKGSDLGSVKALQNEIKSLSGEIGRLLRQAEARLAEAQSGD